MTKMHTPIVTEVQLTEALIRAGKEVEALKAENARLREALTVIANGPCEWPVDAFLAAQCARRALGGEP